MRKTICALAILAGGASTAMADSVKLKYTGATGRGMTVHTSASSSLATTAGRYNFDVNDGSSSGGMFTTGSKIQTFCIDIFQTVQAGQINEYEIAALEDAPVGGSAPAGGMGSDKAEAIHRMFSYVYSSGLDLSSQDNSATLQAAIWEVISDLDTTGTQAVALASLSTSSGDFHIVSGYSGGTTLLSHLFNAAVYGIVDSRVILKALTRDGGQDQMYYTIIPLPTSAGLAAVGLLGVASIRRRRMA